MGNHRHLPVSVVKQVPRGQVASLFFVKKDAVVTFVIDIAVQQHIGHPAVPEQVQGRRFRGPRDDQDPVHLAGKGHFHHALLDRRIVPGAEDHQAVTQPRRLLLDQVAEHSVKGVDHGAGDHGDRLGPPGPQGAGYIIPDITHLPRHLLDLFAGLPGNIRFVLQCAGYRIDRETGCFCDIFQRYPPGGSAHRFRRLSIVKIGSY